MPLLRWLLKFGSLYGSTDSRTVKHSLILWCIITSFRQLWMYYGSSITHSECYYRSVCYNHHNGDFFYKFVVLHSMLLFCFCASHEEVAVGGTNIAETMESKREEFRKYLERGGALQALSYGKTSVQSDHLYECQHVTLCRNWRSWWLQRESVSWRRIHLFALRRKLSGWRTLSL